MKITRDNMRDLKEKLSSLKEMCDVLSDAAEEWASAVDNFEDYKYNAEEQRWWIQRKRDNLGKEFEAFVDYTAKFFDYLQEGRSIEIERGIYLQSLADDRVQESRKRQEKERENRWKRV